MAKKSIAQTVNLQGTPQAPAYKVAAQQVDTFVKGRSAEQILAQDSRMKVAANIDALVETGAAAQKMMYEKQVAALDTTAAQIQSDLDNGVISRIEESGDYSRLPETLRIRIGQTIGKNDARKAYEEVRSRIAEDPNLAVDENAFNQLLAGYNINVDGQDGYSIHRQASQQSAWGDFQAQLRSEALGIRSVENQKTLNRTHQTALLDYLQDGAAKGLSGQQMLAGLVDAEGNEVIPTSGLLNSDVRTNIYNTIKDYAIANNRPDLLEADFLPERFKDDTLKFQIKILRQAMSDEAADKLTNENTVFTLTKKKEDREFGEGIHRKLQAGEIVNINDPLYADVSKSQKDILINMVNNNDETQLSARQSGNNFSNEFLKIRTAIESGQDNISEDYGTSEQELIRYVNTLPLNQSDRTKLLNQLPSIVATGDVTNSKSYTKTLSQIEDIISSKRLAAKAVSLKEDAASLAGDALLEVMEYHNSLYRKAMENDNEIDLSEELSIRAAVKDMAHSYLKDTYGIDDPRISPVDQNIDASSYTASIMSNDEQVEAPPVSKPKNKRQTRAEIEQRNQDKNQQLAEQEEATAALVAQMTDAEKKKYNRTKQIPERLRNKTD